MDRRRLVLLTLGLWVASLAAFGTGASILYHGAPRLWFWSWLALLPVSGMVFSLLLYAGVMRFQPLSFSARWRRLGPAMIVIVLLQAAIDHWLYTLLHHASGSSGGADFLTGMAFNSVLYVWLFGLQALLFELIASRNQAELNARNAAVAGEAARAAQLEALRTELNPHMLFNTFNSLSSLVLAGRNDDAEAMIDRLSVYTRACLEGGDAALIPLADEFELIQAYLDVEAVRFARTPDVRSDCPDDLAEAGVPRLILQPLVENALKYAVHPSRGAATVWIRARRDGDRLRLAVEDTGSGAEPPPGAGTGRGLSMVARRLETLFGAAGTMAAGPSEAGFCVELTLPLTMTTLERESRPD
ncbi:MAG: hypothetical protein EON90_11535 [Brevundimonas sp.]|nr:MAG: hypothetical protein EON90_11535 [Brevundimonas sp.]